MIDIHSPDCRPLWLKRMRDGGAFVGTRDVGLLLGADEVRRMIDELTRPTDVAPAVSPPKARLVECNAE